ncbi:MAG TPA: response regulator, partial [Polyangia bacterium]
NSLDAMVSGGTLTMATGKESDDVFVCVEDTGTGMNRAVKERVFEPFFTTKAAGQGTGLGMSMVYGVVQAMSGRIDLDTAPGMGTSIRLSFPRAMAAPQTAAQPPRPTTERPQSLSGLTVLLIDDEPLVLRSGLRLLRALGCQALGAANGRDGLDIVKERKGAVNLVVVDFIMPDMDGLAVIDELCKVTPEIPVILASGYARDSDRLESVKQRYEEVGFLAKPYRSEDLVRVAAELLHLHGGGTEPRVSDHACDSVH